MRDGTFLVKFVVSSQTQKKNIKIHRKMCYYSYLKYE